MPQTGSIRIAALMGDKENPFWAGMEADYARLSPRFGLAVECFYASPSADPLAQAGELARLGGQGFEAIIINPLSPSNLAEEVIRLSGRGIRFFDVGSKTDQGLIKVAGEAYTSVKTVDFIEQGRLGGRHLAKLTGPGTKAALIGGRAKAAQSRGRLAGAVRALSGSGVEMAAMGFGDFERQGGRAEAARLLKEHPDLAGIFCANDLMALGAAEAADKTGRSGLIVVGVDLIPEAAQAIARGRLAASVAFSRSEVAAKVLEAVKTTLAGGTWPDEYCVASRLATKENLEEFEF